MQISELRDRGDHGGTMLDKFLAQSIVYAESVTDPLDLETNETMDEPILDDLEEEEVTPQRSIVESRYEDPNPPTPQIQPNQNLRTGAQSPLAKF
jgi:hypothetical protein